MKRPVAGKLKPVILVHTVLYKNLYSSTINGLHQWKLKVRDNFFWYVDTYNSGSICYVLERNYAHH